MPEEGVARLVGAALDGDGRAFGRLVERHQRLVFNLARQHAPGRAEAEEIAQEAFVRAYCRLRGLRDPARFAGWLCGITINVAREHARRPRSLSLDAVAEPAAPAPVDAELERRILAAVARLPEKFRVPLTMRSSGRMAYRAIGAALGIDEGTARSRVHRARRRLRAALDR